jgi:hypothetical protein
MRFGYWQFITEEAASAFFEGVNYVNDSEITTHSPYYNSEYNNWEVKLEDFGKDPCPYCGCSECDFNGIYTCDGSLGDIDGLESVEN